MKAPSNATIDRCDLCGYRFEGGLRDRIRHLRGTHRAYARGVLLRVVAPFVFLGTILVLSALRAPQNAYVVALFVAFGLLFVGKLRSRTERRGAGARATLTVRQLLTGGGMRFVMLLPVVVLLLLALARL